MADDRLDWIFEDEAVESLESRYDTWAATYDANHDQWGWRGPDSVVEAALRLATNLDGDSLVIDAGCGTGQAGAALRKAGWPGRLIGLDFSQGMLDVAVLSGAYDELVKCSLLDISLPTDSADAVISSGVFTHGHVGGEALSELCRVTKPGGVVTVTQRMDFGAFMAPHAEALKNAGAWEDLERSDPALFHPDRDEIEHVVVSWMVLT